MKYLGKAGGRVLFAKRVEMSKGCAGGGWRGSKYVRLKMPKPNTSIEKQSSTGDFVGVA